MEQVPNSPRIKKKKQMDATINIRGVPIELKNHFAAHFRLRGTTMTSTIIEAMRNILAERKST